MEGEGRMCDFARHFFSEGFRGGEIEASKGSFFYELTVFGLNPPSLDFVR